MSNLYEQTNSITATTLARSERLCGRFPVLTSEDPIAYREMLISLLECHGPRNFFAEKLVRHLADEEWEISRLRRYKNVLLERRVRASLDFQAYREKATQQDREALTTKLADQPATQFILPEQALEGVIAKVDEWLRRPAEELDHARALEVANVYFAHLDRLLNAATARRNAILEDMDRYDFLFNPSLALSAELAVHELEYRERSGSQDEANMTAPFKATAPGLAPTQRGQS